MHFDQSVFSLLYDIKRESAFGKAMHIFINKLRLIERIKPTLAFIFSGYIEKNGIHVPSTLCVLFQLYFFCK